MINILNIKESPVYDDNIVKVEYHSYSPFLSSFKNNDVINIAIQHQNLNILPSESYLYIEGALLKNDNTISADTKITNNGIVFLFEEIRYEINGIEIDKNRKLGHTSTLKNYVSLNENEAKMLENAGWTYKKHHTSGFFNYCIPLNKLLGFAEDYKKIIPNAKHELILTRSRTDENSYIQPSTSKDLVNFRISKIQWCVPHIILNDMKKLSLLNKVDRGSPIYMNFRSWEIHEYPNLPQTTHHIWAVKTSTQLEKPRFIIFALQTNRENDKTKDISNFDHCNLTDIKVHLNSETYPYEDLNTNFHVNKIATLYNMYCNFQKSYYHQQNLPLLSYDEFKTNNGPLIVIDCSHQDDSLKSGPVDVKLEFKTSENVPEKTSALCLLIHDRIVQHTSLTGEIRKLI
jgi:hypothetical protein